ncbi:MAG: DUF4340 domain-containing protein [Ignavibacteria bacterium]|nr:DUF4340 domain-containing protein [Ignavibacteria bacterium]MBT8382537.1 DUF4340 domain-containing protein [Ignavibacteria bacterium]
MSLKINNRTLGILFAILLVIVIFFVFVDSGKNERTFRQFLVNIDTTAVTEILIYPKSQNHKEVKLFKANGGWKVNLPNGASANVAESRISDLFKQLIAILPKRLAARDEAKWNEFQVDSTGSRVKVIQGMDVTLDLVIGRFSFQQPRTMNTFVRLYNDTDVYEVDGFLDMTFNQGANSFRDGTILNDDFNNWKQLQFNYPADSSFQLIKTGSDWFVNGLKADSTKAINYLRRLSQLSNTTFVDDFDSTNIISPTYLLNISTTDLKFIELKGFVNEDHYLVRSTENPEVYFDGNSVGKTIFVGKSEFLP